MFTSQWNRSKTTHRPLENAPTNKLLTLIRQMPRRARLGYSLALGAVFLLASAGTLRLVEIGWPEFLYLPFLVLLVIGLKFAIYFAATLIGAILLVPFRLAGRLSARFGKRQAEAPAVESVAEVEQELVDV